MGSSPVKYKIVGALTLKSFPFILRSWNVKNYDSINPTDSFGQEIQVYVNKNKIVKIEPQFSNSMDNFWLTDKGRQFFDGIFINSSDNNVSLSKTTKQWENLFLKLQKTFYLFDICNFKTVNKFHCLIVFETLSIENISFLLLISQAHSIIKIKRIENVKFDSNLESNFQINSSISTQKQLASSSLCLLIGTNTRYEGSYLNLKLRQRYLKGSFKLFLLGSLFDLTFPVTSLGSNMFSLKMIAEGNHVACKELVNAVNPLVITNSEVFKNKNLQEFFSYLKVLRSANILNKVWNGFNVLNSSLYETGVSCLGQFSFLTLKDLLSFSSFYIINVNLNNVANFKKVLESRIINYKSLRLLKSRQLVLTQNLNVLSNDSKKFKNFLYLPTNNFFKEKETFVNTEGLIKRTSKIIQTKHVKSDWQLLRKFVKTLDLTSKIKSSLKNDLVVNNINKSLLDYRNFIGFQFYASKTLINLNFYLSEKNQQFSVFKKYYRFGFSSVKLYDNKLKYWLDDFYTGGKDSFCSNSLTLVKCSIGYKLQSTNFF